MEVNKSAILSLAAGAVFGASALLQTSSARTGPAALLYGPVAVLLLAGGAYRLR